MSVYKNKNIRSTNLLFKKDLFQIWRNSIQNKNEEAGGIKNERCITVITV
jgi:hypothetical protein